MILSCSKVLKDLKDFERLAVKWTKRINLVSSREAGSLWERHILDSAQMFHVKQSWDGRYVDLGSGGGFPGLVLAIFRKHHAIQSSTILVESDQRKCVFLRAAARELSVSVDVKSTRIEALEPQAANTLTARALSDLSTLLGYTQTHLAPSGTALFPKGAKWQQEINVARKTWAFDLTVHQSKTHPEGRILEIGGISRV